MFKHPSESARVRLRMFHGSETSKTLQIKYKNRKGQNKKKQVGKFYPDVRYISLHTHTDRRTHMHYTHTYVYACANVYECTIRVLCIFECVCVWRFARESQEPNQNNDRHHDKEGDTGRGNGYCSSLTFCLTSKGPLNLAPC